MQALPGLPQAVRILAEAGDRRHEQLVSEMRENNAAICEAVQAMLSFASRMTSVAERIEYQVGVMSDGMVERLLERN